MYVIVMDKNKNLIATQKQVLYQGENLIDKIVFRLPATYNDLDISEFNVEMIYIIPGNVQMKENLRLSDSLCKDTHLAYCVQIDSNLTSFAGDIDLVLRLTKTDTLAMKKYIMYTNKIKIKINPTNSSFRMVQCDCENNEFEVVEF